MASIKFDDGREVTLSAETTERLKKELLNNIPNYIMVGQVFEINGDKYMVSALGMGGKGLTSVGNCPGCWSSFLFDGPTKDDSKLKDLLVRKNAMYLGKFNDVFKTI